MVVGLVSAGWVWEYNGGGADIPATINKPSIKIVSRLNILIGLSQRSRPEDDWPLAKKVNSKVKSVIPLCSFIIHYFSC